MSRSRVQSHDVWPADTEEDQFTHAAIDLLPHKNTTKVPPTPTAFQFLDSQLQSAFRRSKETKLPEQEEEIEAEPSPINQFQRTTQFNGTMNFNGQENKAQSSEQSENENSQPVFPMGYSGMLPGHGFVPFMTPFMHDQMAYMAVPVNLNMPLSLNAHCDFNLPSTTHDLDIKEPNIKRKRKNRLCTQDGCSKNARGRTDFCVRHGGGTRCSVHGCEKGARPHSQLCSSHGGGHRCLFPGCNKGALAKSVYCRRHGKMAQNQRQPQQQQQPSTV